MPAVAGLRGTGDVGTDERPKNFREMILFRQPMGTAPIFALTSRAKKKSVDDPEFAWWDEPNDIIRLQVNGAVGSTAADQVIAVDSGDPDATDPSKVWGLATHLKQGDLLLVEGDTTTFNQEVVEVTNVISTTQFTVRRGASGTTIAAIADNVFLLLIGSSYAEGTSEPKAVSRNPIKYSNFTQIFKNTYELSGTADKTRFRTGSPWSNDKKRKMFDHARDIEHAILWGRKSEVTSVINGKPLRTTAGLRAQIATQNVTVFGVAVTISSFLDAVFKVFDFDTPAGDERICFCGNAALNSLNKVIQADPNSEIQYGGVIRTYGLNFREFILPQGRLLLRTHPLLNRNALYSRSMYVLDFSSITYVPLQGRDTKTMDDIQTKGEDVRRGFIQTECGFAVDRGGLTCGYLGNINNV